MLPNARAGGVYFADDDNTYDLRVFEAVRAAQAKKTNKQKL